MVTYILEFRNSPVCAWVSVGSPMMKADDAVVTAATLSLCCNAEIRIRGLQTELQPDGTIIRRELSPEELADAIRGEHVPTKPVKAVVVVRARYGIEAVYVDGYLSVFATKTEAITLGPSDLEAISAGKPITIRAVMLDCPIEDWPTELAALRIDD